MWNSVIYSPDHPKGVFVDMYGNHNLSIPYDLLPSNPVIILDIHNLPNRIYVSDTSEEEEGQVVESEGDSEDEHEGDHEGDPESEYDDMDDCQSEYEQSEVDDHEPEEDDDIQFGELHDMDLGKHD